MDLLTILVETKNDFVPAKHDDDINLSDPYFDNMEKHYDDINKYICTTCDNKKGKEKGELLRYINKMLKMVLKDEDLMQFVLEHLDDKYASIDEF